MRDSLIAALTERIEYASRTGDLGSVLHPAVIDEIGALLLAVPAPHEDADIITTLFMLYNLRQQALGLAGSRTDNEDDLYQTALLLQILRHLEPSRVNLDLPPSRADSAWAADRPAALLIRPAVQLHQRFTESGDVNALLPALELFRRASSAAPTGSPNQVRALSNLCGALNDLFEVSGERDLLLEAVAKGQMLAERSTMEAVDLWNYSLALRRLAQQSTSREIALEAVKMTGRVARTLPPESPMNETSLMEYGLALTRLYEHNHSLATLTRSITTYRRAIARGGSRVSFTQSMLSVSLVSLFEHTRVPALLDQAVAIGRAAVSTASIETPDWAVCRAHLAIALKEHFEQTSTLATLHEAVDLLRAARAASVHANDHASHVANLSSCLQRLHWRTRELDVLREAVDRAEEAVDLYDATDAEYVRVLSNYAAGLRELYQRTNDAAVLRQAVSVSHQAVTAAQGDRANLPRTWHNHGAVLDDLWKATDSADVLAEAISAARNAIETASDLYGDKAVSPSYLSNLCALLRDLAAATHDTQALWNAVALVRDAVARTTTDHTARCMHLINLSLSLCDLYKQTRERSLQAEAVEAARSGAQAESAPVDLRVLAAKSWALSSLAADDYAQAMDAFDYLIETLLPQLAPHDSQRLDREYGLRSLSSIGAEAAGVALALGEKEKAVELVERSRGILATEWITIHHDLPRLREVAPRLATEFETLRQLLHTTTQASELGVQQAERGGTGSRPQIVTRWTELMGKIRAQNGFQSFLRPPPFTTSGPALAGPIVMVGLSQERGFALILAGDSQPRHLPLPGLTSTDVEARIKDLRLATAPNRLATISERMSANSRLLSILEWLWDTTVEPVLSELDHQSPPSTVAALPRIWWCPLGYLALFPLHAAGHYASTTTDTALDRVISSYTPTLRALHHSRAQNSYWDRPGALVVAIPEAAGMEPLPGAALEANSIRDLMPSATMLVGEYATREVVLEMLPQHAIVHFACHATSRWDSPSESGLVLGRSASLSAAAVAELDLDKAGLAYLSACDTADAGLSLPDEAVHITSAFMIAGFAHVIGTLWPVDDQSGGTIARAFYERLSDGRLDPNMAPHALHHAVRHMRDLALTKPLEWAGYIHAGR